MTGPSAPISEQTHKGKTEPEHVALVHAKHFGGLNNTGANPLLSVPILILFFITAQYIDNRFGWTGLLVLLSAMLVVVIAVSSHVRSKNAPARILNKDELSSMPPGARLQAVGNLMELSHLADIEDFPFEPVIVERHYAAKSLWVYVLVGFLIGGVIQCGMGVFFSQRFNITGAGYALGLAIAWLPARLIPTYYRFVPGQMDILRFSVLTGKARLLNRFNLREAKVRVSFEKQIAEIRTTEGQNEDIRLWTIAEPYRFLRGLFHAAISTASAPPLPDDQLLG